MQLTVLTCPACATAVVVDTSLYRIGTVKVRCVGCTDYFLPTGSPHDLTVEAATNASVPITVVEPLDTDTDSDTGGDPHR